MKQVFDLDGRKIEITVRHNARARRLTLRLDRRSRQPVITLPPGAKFSDALTMVERHKGWLKGQLCKLGEVTPFQQGEVFTLRGVATEIIHSTQHRGTVHFDDATNRLYVTGDPAFSHRRICDWLKKQARADIGKWVALFCDHLGCAHARINVRDTVSRWGSCASNGNLSFSWRLIMAPPEILRYVVAHEIAHLRHMDHSPAFWAVVDELVPDAKSSRKWLNLNGHHLHRFASTSRGLA